MSTKTKASKSTGAATWKPAPPPEEVVDRLSERLRAKALEDALEGLRPGEITARADSSPGSPAA